MFSLCRLIAICLVLSLVRDASSYSPPPNGKPHRRAIKYNNLEQIRKRNVQSLPEKHGLQVRHFPSNNGGNTQQNSKSSATDWHFSPPADCPALPPYGCPNPFWPDYHVNTPAPSYCPEYKPLPADCKKYWVNVWKKYWNGKKTWNGKAHQKVQKDSSDYGIPKQHKHLQPVPQSKKKPEIQPKQPPTTQSDPQPQSIPQHQSEPMSSKSSNSSDYSTQNGEDWEGQQNPHAFSGTNEDVAKHGFKGKRMSGDMTFFGPGFGACGWPEHDYENVVAVSGQLFQIFGNGITNGNPVCGHKIRIFKNGKTAIASITDECNECALGSLDMSPTLFKYFVELQVGRTSVEWEFI